MTITARKVDDEILVQQDLDEYMHMYSRNLFSFKIKDMSALLSFLVKRGLLSKRVLEGILAETEE
jgi:hypothetical protein